MVEWMCRSRHSWPRHSWRWAVSVMHRPLYPRGKRPCYKLSTRLGEPQRRYGQSGEGTLESTGTRPARSQALYQLRYPRSVWNAVPVYCWRDWARHGRLESGLSVSGRYLNTTAPSVKPTVLTILRRQLTQKKLRVIATIKSLIEVLNYLNLIQRWTYGIIV
jgi:hypothetical protein